VAGRRRISTATRTRRSTSSRAGARSSSETILTFTPAGIEEFFLETLERALDPTLDPPEPPDAVAARYAAAAPRYGLEFLTAGA
jgi:hypothetical protein